MVGPLTHIRREEPGADAPHLDAIHLQLVVIIQHQHIERGLGAAVPDRLELLHLLGPAALQRPQREILPRGLLEGIESRDKDEPWVAGLQEQRHERPRHYVRTSHVDIIRAGEALT